MKLPKEVKEVILSLISEAQAGPPPPPDHVCGGANSSCDAGCMDHADYCRRLDNAREILRKCDWED